ncbi:MAG: adenylosuccinate lyase, partial [Candidatus Brocadiaceae bacterium]
RITHDPSFSHIKSKLKEIADPDKLVGRAPQQTEEFVNQVVNPILRRYGYLIDEKMIPTLQV